MAEPTRISNNTTLLIRRFVRLARLIVIITSSNRCCGEKIIMAISARKGQGGNDNWIRVDYNFVIDN